MFTTRADLRKARRLVVKVGTNILFEKGELSKNRMKSLAGQIAALKKEGREVLVVTSGAIGAGFKKLGLAERPRDLKMKQACAAVGQLYLMAAWEKVLAAEGAICAQILISASDLAERGRFLNAKNTLLALLERGVVPIINENDTVATDELKVGDNDTLGALVAGLAEADLFINLTDIDGLYTADPRSDPEARLIEHLHRVTGATLASAGGGGPLGTGGMYTKVRAAKRLADLGAASIIAGGGARNVLLKIVEGDPIGTFFSPPNKRLAAKKSWLAFASRPRGQLTVDKGCAAALVKKGKSLLPGGITAAVGAFNAGDAVAIVDETGQKLAVGLINYSSAEVEKIKGLPSKKIILTLGYSHSDEVIHRDNMVLSEGLL